MKKVFLFVAALCATVALNAKTITLEPGSGKIAEAVASAEAGDIIELTGDGTAEYVEGNSIQIDKAITIRAAEGATPVVHIMKFKMDAAFAVEGIEFYGYEDYMFRTSVGGNFALSFKNCLIRNSSAYFIYISDGQTIDALTIDNCIFKDNTKSEQPVINGYGAIKSFEMKNTTIMNCAGAYAVRVRNSNHVLIDHCTIYNVGKQAIRLVEDSRSTSDVLVSNTVVANVAETTDYAYYIYNGAVKNCVYYNTGSYRSDNATAENLVNADPKFVNAAEGNLNWTSDSPLKGTAIGGGNIGDPRWTEAKAEMVFSFLTPAAAGEEAINDYTIKFAAVVPEGSANYAIAYSYDGETWTDIVAETAYTDQTEATFATRGLDEGEVTLRGILTTDKDTVITICPNTLTIVKDTEAPRAIANLFANVDGTTATLTWKNPTVEVPVMGSLLGEEDLLELASTYTSSGSTVNLAEENNTVKVTVSTGSWAQAGISFDVTAFENVQKAAFKVKGDGATQLDVFMVQNGYDWWNKAFTPGSDWETFENSEWSKVTWHNNSKATEFDGNNVTNLMIVVDNATDVTDFVFYLDSVMIEGTIAPSKYYAKTIIRRSTEDYPETIEDGDAVYEGTAETTTNEIDPTKTYYYTAFAVDDIANVSEPTTLLVEGKEVTHTLFNVTVPEGTDACYLVGSMNSWAVDDPIEMTKVDDTHYTYQAETDLTDAQYKYVHGDDWSMVEKAADGSEMGNRTVNAAVMNDTVAKWADAPTGLQSTKAIKAARKAFFNNQIVIERNGVRFNVLGTQF